MVVLWAQETPSEIFHLNTISPSFVKPLCISGGHKAARYPKFDILITKNMNVSVTTAASLIGTIYYPRARLLVKLPFHLYLIML